MNTDVARFSAKALALLEALACAPTPEAYTVAYRHAENPTGPVARAVEESIRGGRVDEAAILGVFRRQIDDRRADAIDAAAAGTRQGTDQSIEAVTRAEESTAAFLRDLIGARADLNAAPGPDAAALIAGRLSDSVAALAVDQASAKAALMDVRERMAELQERYEQALDQARCDGLTELCNRRAFEQHLVIETARAARSGAPLALVTLDIDLFKSINDTYGHAAGDGVIKAVAAALRATIRTGDVPARIGGEEFAVLLPGVGLDVAATVAERIRRHVEALRVRNVRGFDPQRSFTVSAGVVQFEPGEDGASALARADANLYAAKRGGRNRVATTDDARRAA